MFSNRIHFLHVIYLATFFYALHFAITLYIESSYLRAFFSERTVGLIYIMAATLSIATVVKLPRVLSIYGNYRSTLTLIFLEVASLFGLATTSSPYSAILFFVAHQIFLATLFVSVNIFLENFSSDETTGRTRGTFLTVVNTAILLGPLVASGFLKDSNFDTVFLLSALFIFPMFILIATNFKKYRDPIYNKLKFLSTIIEVAKRPNVFKISVVRFLIEFFYSIMIIYTPIYLHTQMQIPFSEILGIIMPIALSPFVIFPYLLGNIADKKLGEKELLTIGIILCAFITMSLSFISSGNIFAWALLLFMTRVGASFIEEMSDSYFFKHVNASDSNLIAFFSNLRPAAFIAGPMLATLFLLVFPFNYIFLGLGAFMLYGLRYSLRLKDTR
ncbi:MAG: MFS transporter [Patescibacteria group bacterium]